MDHLDNINTFISQLKVFFPETIEYYEGKDTDFGVRKSLSRHILYINDSKTITTSNNDDDDNVVNNETSVEILRKFLNILDINLGDIYKEVSYQIYNNRKSWKVNKWEEMLSPGLIYVSYWGMDTDDETNYQPMLFLSFMLTDEIDVSRIGMTDFVVYLYEIQILPKIRGIGIGQRLLGCLKDTSIGYNNNNNSSSSSSSSNLNNNIKSISNNGDSTIRAIVLTVFSKNETAMKFYNKLQFKFTFGSPRDEHIDRIANRTRKRQQSTQNTTTNQSVVKPIYYILYLPL